ncbi:hypothetical protein MNBD_GAMMA24-360 [hydrothermal vent metagenome]|uniref:PEP-CTERM protein-sorting domain-containing protein n=1 Tax=hydrothermal vent metagenome TaxID=652676 RepID=A0A3B1B3Z8_9ZZZZ
MSITNSFKSILVGFGMLLLAFNVSAYPLLTFDGGMVYDSESKLFAVGAGLTGSEDIGSAPKFAGSSFQFTGLLDTSSVSTNTYGTIAKFTGSTSGSAPLLSVVDGDGFTLLKGELTGLMMRGLDGSTIGVLDAQFNPTSGTLLNEFAVGAKLFALQLNLSTNFASNLFYKGYGGKVDGRLYAPASVSVPEPGVLVLFMLGLGLLVMTTWKKSGQKF